ncbi:Phosphoglycerate mutase family protein [Raphanus sativus]|nr:Phosphoglycerate mutase family protein [Raphanus sativus]
MDTRFLYPLESCKIIHLLRHGQAVHNVEAEKDRNALLSPHLFDAPLTDHGHQQIESEEDNLWRPDVRESEEEILARGLEFMKWLWKRPEKEVAVVSHGIVLQHMLYVFANDCDVSVRHELCKRFANCEIRTVVIVDKSFSSSTEI